MTRLLLFAAGVLAVLALGSGPARDDPADGLQCGSDWECEALMPDGEGADGASAETGSDLEVVL